MHYRADQLGSLLRPAELLEGRTAYAAGRMSSGKPASISSPTASTGAELFAVALPIPSKAWLPLSLGAIGAVNPPADRVIRNELLVEDCGQFAGSRRTSRRF